MSPDVPWGMAHVLEPASRAGLRRRAIFECCKWDPQVEDVSTLAPVAVVLEPAAWRKLADLAEALAAETLALEVALIQRPDLHRPLALPWAVRRALGGTGAIDSRPHDVRVMRFDFHPTPEGWRISEANTDVPGGFNEASGLAALVAEQVPGAAPAGDPARQLVRALGARMSPGATVALVHATGYTDDRQVMVFLARQLEQRGFQAVLVSPSHLRWIKGRAVIESDWFKGPADLVLRFFPAEWLPNLGRGVAWHHFFGRAQTPLCNPATALVTQSKRLPLVWDELDLALPTWRRLLPETRDPRAADWRRSSDWVLKPALGRVGDMVGLEGITSERDWRSIRRGAGWHPRHWVAQRRFASTPLVVEGSPWHVCLGVFTVNGKAAGIYGRMAARPLINHSACEMAVLVERPRDPREQVRSGGASASASQSEQGAHSLARQSLPHLQTTEASRWGERLREPEPHFFHLSCEPVRTV